MKIAFEKYHGTGNDFIAIDNRNGAHNGLKTETIQRWCRRRFGIGSDGLMLIQESKTADFEMVFFNPDGSKSLCGNGSRCAVVFAKKLGLARQSGTFLTTDGLHAYRILDNDVVAIQMRDVGRPVKVRKHRFLDTGSPHLVVKSKDVDQVNVLKHGRRLRHLPAFEDRGGTNVNFAAPLGENEIGVRTYERGVEAETLSCGTGVTAVALALASDGITGSPVKVHTHGGVLQVEFVQTEEGFEGVWLTGPVSHVYSGEIDA